MSFMTGRTKGDLDNLAQAKMYGDTRWDILMGKKNVTGDGQVVDSTHDIVKAAAGFLTAPRDINQQVGQALADQGRGTDSMIAHVTPGELLIPPELLERFPALHEAVRAAFSNMGADHREYVVGSHSQKINPLTGQPEFFGKFVKKAFKSVKKVVKKVMSNPITAAVATMATGGALAPLVGGSLALGTGLASAGLGLASGQSLGSAALSGLTAGMGSAAAGTLGSKIAGGALGSTASGAATTTLGSLANKVGLGSLAFNALDNTVKQGLGSTLLGGLLDTNLGQYAGAIATGLGSNPGAAPKPSGSTKTPGAGQTAQLPAAASTLPSVKGGGDATGSNAGAGAVPFSPNAVDSLAKAGVSFINPVGNRDTGQVDYSNSPFSNSLRNVRRGTWGGSLLQV